MSSPTHLNLWTITNTITGIRKKKKNKRRKYHNIKGLIDFALYNVFRDKITNNLINSKQNEKQNEML